MEISESSTSKKTNIIEMANYLEHLRVKLKKHRGGKKTIHAYFIEHSIIIPHLEASEK